MEEYRDLNNKRVCDYSEDRKVVAIVRKDCATYITAQGDGTLKIISKRLPQSK